MTQLTDAPELISLPDLQHGWHKVLTMSGKMRKWHGDLAETGPRRLYEGMILDGAIVATQYRVSDGVYRVFAKMADGVAFSPRNIEGKTLVQLSRLARNRR